MARLNYNCKPCALFVYFKVMTVHVYPLQLQIVARLKSVAIYCDTTVFVFKR